MAITQAQLRMSEVISALSYALDITEGQPPGHAVRSCLIGMRLADELELGPQERSDLYYALLLKDAGCSSSAAKICSLFRGDDLRVKGGIKTVEWTSLSENFLWAVRTVAPESSPLGRAAALVRLGFKQGAQKDIFETRCERGADIARELGFPEATAAAIRTLDEHWDGRGQRLGLRGVRYPYWGGSSVSRSRSTSSSRRMGSRLRTGWPASGGAPGSTRRQCARSRRSKTTTTSGPALLQAMPMSWSPRSSRWITSSGSTSRGSTVSRALSPA